MSLDKVLSQASSDLLFGLLNSEPLLEGIGLYSTLGRLELEFYRTGFAHQALNHAIGPVIAKFGNNIIFYCHEEGDLGYLETETHLVWFEPVATSHILAYILPRDGKAVFLTENLKNTSRSLHYLLEKQRRMLRRV